MAVAVIIANIARQKGGNLLNRKWIIAHMHISVIPILLVIVGYYGV
jgi:hypothetical protein